jgi:hypothetical protein
MEDIEEMEEYKMNLIIHNGKVIDISYGILPDHLRHISIPVDNIRKLGCQWIVNGQKCKRQCAPFLFVCDDHKNIPDFPRRYLLLLNEHTLRHRKKS